MKKILFMLSVLCATVFAGEVVPADTIKDARKQVEQKCTKGCLILTPQEVQNIQKNINDVINQAQQEAFEVGKTICNKSI